MIEQGRGENAGDHRFFIGETRGEKQSQQLGFVADFGDKDTDSWREKGFHQELRTVRAKKKDTPSAPHGANGMP